jgi:DNA-binding NtrC family response regulator
MPARRVLVVDDEMLIRWSLSQRLLSAGYEVHEACDWSSALAYFAEGAPSIDAVVLDLKLPDTDGVGVLEQIKARRPACAVVMMSAFVTADVSQKAHDHGIFEVVPKPFDIDAMVRMVERALA